MCRRSLSSSRISLSLKLSEARPARTPPSTFLFLHLHLSNSAKPKLRRSQSTKVDTCPTPYKGYETLIRRRVTTDNYRLFLHSPEMRELPRRAFGRGRLAAAASARRRWPVYSPTPEALSTPDCNKIVMGSKKIAAPRMNRPAGPRAAPEPHSC